MEMQQILMWMRTGFRKSESLRASPLTMNSWPSTLVSPLDLCSSVIQWCISSGVSALQWSTRLAVMITNELGLSGGERRKQNHLAPLKPSPPSEPRLNVFFPAYGSWGEKWQCYLYFLLRQSSLISAGFISCLINLYTWSNTFWKVLEGKTFLHAKLSRRNSVPGRLTKVTAGERFFLDASPK